MLILSSHPGLYLSIVLFRSDCPTKTSHYSHTCYMPRLSHFITVIIHCEGCKLWSSLLSNCCYFIDLRSKYSSQHFVLRCLQSTRTVRKVRGLTLLLGVGTLWRCGDGLFFEVPPLASDALLTTLYPLLENVLQTVDHFEISCLWAPFSWLEKPRNRMGRDQIEFCVRL
jgi:hypothetical protein